MSVATKLQEVYDNSNRVKELNTELETILSGKDSGGKSWYDEFWDTFQDSGARTVYSRAFGAEAWNDTSFKPKYNMKPTSASMMFSYSRITDLAQILNDCGVTLDLSQCTTITDCFSYGKITHIPELDLRNFDKVSYGTYNAISVHTIDKIILREDGSQTFEANLVNNSGVLKNIVFEGVIGDSLKMSKPPFTVDSLLNIIEHLQDLVEAGKDTCTLTIGSTNLAKLTDEQKAIATQKGWTLA